MTRQKGLRTEGPRVLTDGRQCFAGALGVPLEGALVQNRHGQAAPAWAGVCPHPAYPAVITPLTHRLSMMEVLTRILGEAVVAALRASWTRTTKELRPLPHQQARGR